MVVLTSDKILVEVGTNDELDVVLDEVSSSDDKPGNKSLAGY